VVPRGFGETGCVTSLTEALFSVGCAEIVDVGSVVALRANIAGSRLAIFSANSLFLYQPRHFPESK